MSNETRIAASSAAARPRLARRSAFTLLEVLLTLLIASMLIAAIGAAVNVHYRVVDAGRAEVEQAQLARVLLRRIGDDLRAAAPLSTDAGSFDAATAAAASGASSASSLTGSTGASASAGGALDSMSAATAAAAAAAGESLPADDGTIQPPAFFGTATELQLDVLHRADLRRLGPVESDAALNGGVAPADMLCDVETVTYRLGALANPAAAVDPLAVDPLSADPATAGGIGLIRSAVPRAVAHFAATQGGLDVATAERLLAGEVVALQFQYFDGTQWLTDWDSGLMGALPRCVEVLLTLRTAAPGTSAVDLFSPSLAPNAFVEKTYRLIVTLPAGDTMTLNADAATATESPATEATP